MGMMGAICCGKSGHIVGGLMGEGSHGGVARSGNWQGGMGVVQIGTGFVGRASPYDDSMENGKGRGRSETVVVEYKKCVVSAD